MWSEVPWVNYYIAYVKSDDGLEENCNTTDRACHFQCKCGYTYLSTVFAYNQAGSSPPGQIVNYTTSLYFTQTDLHLYIYIYIFIHIYIELIKSDS